MFSDQQWSFEGSAKCSSSCGSATTSLRPTFRSGRVNRELPAISTVAHQEFRGPRGRSRLKHLRLLTQGLRPTHEGVADSCLAAGQKNLLLRHTRSGALWGQRCAADALDFRKVEPQMPAVIVLAEHDFTIGAGDGAAELVAIAALLKNRSGDPQISDTT